MKIRTTIFILMLGWSAASYAQDRSYALAIVDTLTQASYGGRGYDGSDKKAAGFLRRQMQEIGLQSVQGSYFQHFPISINSIVDGVRLRLDDSLMKPGDDYLVLLSSPSIEGKFELLYLPVDSSGNPSLIMNPSVYKDKFVVTELHPEDFRAKFPFPCKGVIYLKDQSFFWHISDGREVSDRVEIYLRKEKYSTDYQFINIHLKTQFQDPYITQNVLGMVRGSKYPDRYIFLTAHYDHLGRMGKETFFPGGHDNASGTATVLDLARYYVKHPPKYSIVFLLFSGEEAGLLGSFYYVRHPLIPLSKIRFVLNLDLMGSGSKCITVVNGSVFPEAFKKLKRINRCRHLLYQIKARGKAANSDHFPFSESGVPSFFFYTMGSESSAYHSPQDDASNVHFTDYDDIFKLITTFVKKL